MSPIQAVSPTRWSLSVSAETDAYLREYLGTQGMKKGDLSRFVEEAVRWRLLDSTTSEIRQRNSEMGDAALQALIDQALGEVRQAQASWTYQTN